MRNWPTRRVQLGAVVFLAVAFALQVFRPLPPKERAEKLYEDSWFNSVRDFMNPENLNSFGSNPRAVPKLEKALALDPGNSLYEQALVWRYPREKLPTILKERKLGQRARSLAAGLIYQGLENKRSFSSPVPGMPPPPGVTVPGPPPPPGAPAGGPPPGAPGFVPPPPAPIPASPELLRALDDLERADPENALVRYARANVFERAGRLDEMAAEVRAGNRLREMRFFVPEIPMSVLDSAISPYYFMPSEMFPRYANLREVARGMVSLAEERRKEGRDREAVVLLEDCCAMGVNLASSKPRQIIPVLVGKAIFSIGWKPLRPLYRKLGMTERLREHERLSRAFEKGLAECRKFNKTQLSVMMERLSRNFALPAVFLAVWAVLLLVLALSLLLWIPAAVARRRRGEGPVTLSPWGEGWLARLFLAVLLPAWGAIAAAAILRPSLLEPDSPIAVLSLINLSELVLVALVLRTLRRRYDEGTGMLRFLFKAPAAGKAWTRKYLTAALAAQLLFLAVVMLPASMVYKGIYGVPPWQVLRLSTSSFSREQRLCDRIAADLGRARPASYRR
ncbi:MAG: hypothetical protein ACYC2Y_10625 [Armatimonadota bacterium]